MIHDLFAGPGGWDEGLRLAGRTDVIGFDSSEPACLTATAAGHARVFGDLSKITSERLMRGRGEVEGVVASPPCPGFSTAGKGAGRRDLELLFKAIEHMVAGRPWTDVERAVIARQNDPRSVLTLQPLRWIMAVQPEWMALEQVPVVLPVWQAYAAALEDLGYAAWCGKLHAEQYGVPQTRTRAVLTARRHVAEAWPVPTHSRFHVRDRKRLDPGVLPWVSMAEALGWGMAERPSPTITGGGTATGGAEPIAHLSRYSEADDWIQRSTWRERMVKPDEAIALGREDWPTGRPSPTIVGSFAPDVVAYPVYRKPGDGPRQNTPGGIRVTVQEAGILQSFREDYPWQGSRTQQYQQVGDAVPPLLAKAIVESLLA